MSLRHFLAKNPFENTKKNIHLQTKFTLIISKRLLAGLFATTLGLVYPTLFLIAELKPLCPFDKNPIWKTYFSKKIYIAQPKVKGKNPINFVDT